MSKEPEPKKMSPGEYESFIYDVVSSLTFCRDAQIIQNHRVEGVRQPGVYEIDIYVEVRFDDKLRFLLIVECKNWARPVDRPVVQKLIQTRDALSAQKAAIVSPVGFTREAIDVAWTNGISLWVISRGTQMTVLEIGIPEHEEARRRYSFEREMLVSHFSTGPSLIYKPKSEVDEKESTSLSDREHDFCVLIDAEHAYQSGKAASPYVFNHLYQSHEPRCCGQPGIDPRTAQAQIIDEIVHFLKQDKNCKADESS